MKAQNFLAKNPTEWDDDPSYQKLKTAVKNESSNKIMTVQELNWRQFITESSFFYFGLIPRSEGPARISYVNIGRTMYEIEKYPVISAKGSTPWVSLC